MAASYGYSLCHFATRKKLGARTQSLYCSSNKPQVRHRHEAILLIFSQQIICAKNGVVLSADEATTYELNGKRDNVILKGSAYVCSKLRNEIVPFKTVHTEKLAAGIIEGT